jgi:hypothetical protein
VPQDDAQAAGGAVRGEHRLEHRERDARLVRERADPARARVEVGPRAGGGGQREVLPVVGTDAVAQPPVVRGDAEALDPRVLVRRHRLGRELSAEPAPGLGEDDVGAALCRGERGGHAAQAAADDQHLGTQLAHPRQPTPVRCRA